MRAKPLPAETRRAVTVEAVIELAAERDPGEITTAAIASHMKLTQGALFRHFPSKDAIWDDYVIGALHGVSTAVFSAAFVERTERGDANFLSMARGGCALALHHGSLDKLKG